MAPTHECPRCGYKAKRKDYLQSHLYRKVLCPPSKSDITIKELRAQLGISKPPTHTCNLCGKFEGPRQTVHYHSTHCCPELKASMTSLAAAAAAASPGTLRSFKDPDTSFISTADLQYVSKLPEGFQLVGLYRCVFDRSDLQYGNHALITMPDVEDSDTLQCWDLDGTAEGAYIKLPAAEALWVALTKPMSLLSSHLQQQGSSLPLILQIHHEAGGSELSPVALPHVRQCLQQVQVCIELRARGGLVNAKGVCEAVWSAAHNPVMKGSHWKGDWTL